MIAGVFGVALFGAMANMQPSILTQEDYERLVAPSDDFGQHGPAFAGAARWLIEAGICAENDLRVNGGWVTSWTHSDQPIYFTYCGGSNLADRVYFNAESMEFYGRARGTGDNVRLVDI